MAAEAAVATPRLTWEDNNAPNDVDDCLDLAETVRAGGQPARPVAARRPGHTEPMLLRYVYQVTLDSTHARFVLPMHLSGDAGVSCVLDSSADGYQLIVDQRVSAAALRGGQYRDSPAGTPGDRYVVLGQELQDVHVLVQDVASALSFITDDRRGPLVRRDQRLVAETPADEDVLAALGSDQPYIGRTATLHQRTFLGEVDDKFLQRLFDRRLGLRLYAQSLRSDYEVAKYRDLWRVLESAFGRQGNGLVNELAHYSPAHQLGFDEAELQGLKELRDSASHAQLRGGLAEFYHVEAACGSQLRRLKSLVERVLLTKRDWGRGSKAVEELTPLYWYVGADGESHYADHPGLRGPGMPRRKR
jgi:hypothetical protein